MDIVEKQYITDSKGKKKAVIVPLNKYKDLLEDIHDLAMIAERREEKVISLEEMKKRLEKDGLL